MNVVPGVHVSTLLSLTLYSNKHIPPKSRAILSLKSYNLGH